MNKNREQMISEIDKYCDKIKDCAQSMNDETVDNPIIILIAKQIAHYHNAINNVKKELNWLKETQDSLKEMKQK